MEVIKLNKEKFLNNLREKLSNLSKEEQDKIILDYEKRFDEAEKNIINEIGDVDKVAENILKDNKQQDFKYNDNKENYNVNITSIILMILLVIILSPIIIPIACAAIGIFIALFFAGIGIGIAGFALGSIGIISLFLAPANGLLMFGVGLILLALGIVLTVCTVYIAAVIVPVVIRGIVNVCRLPFKKGV
jgi:uncharacterized membrane protein